MKEAEKIWLYVNRELFLATSFRSLQAFWAVFIAVILDKSSPAKAICQAVASGNPQMILPSNDTAHFY